MLNESKSKIAAMLFTSDVCCVRPVRPFFTAARPIRTHEYATHPIYLIRKYVFHTSTRRERVMLAAFCRSDKGWLRALRRWMRLL
jgi:hypothetical protein